MADAVISSSLVQPSPAAPYETGIAAVQITAGQGVYRDGADRDRVKLAVATALASANARGIATCNASSGQPVRWQTFENLNLGGGVSVGTVYGVSTNAGGIAPITDVTTGNYITTFGVGATTNIIALQVHRSGVQKL